MLKSYLEYIKEHFGAITIEYPPEDMFVKNPNLPQPLSINTWVGGTGRIPMHWNNSPYLSGGFGGSGYGRFGLDPDEGNIDINDSLDSEMDKKIEIIASLSNVLYSFMDKTNYNRTAEQMVRAVENRELNLEDSDDGVLNNTLNDIGIDVSVEIIESPEPGDMGDYWTPPSGGESGVYETYITGPSELSSVLGISDLGKIPAIDDIIEMFMDDKTIIRKIFNEYGPVGMDCYNHLLEEAMRASKKLETEYEIFDEKYFENDGSSSLPNDEMLHELTEIENYGVFKYLIDLSMSIPGKEHVALKRKIAQDGQTVKSVQEIRSKAADIKKVIGYVIEMPEQLKKL